MLPSIGSMAAAAPPPDRTVMARHGSSGSSDGGTPRRRSKRERRRSKRRHRRSQSDVPRDGPGARGGDGASGTSSRFLTYADSDRLTTDTASSTTAGHTVVSRLPPASLTSPQNARVDATPKGGLAASLATVGGSSRSRKSRKSAGGSYRYALMCDPDAPPANAHGDGPPVRAPSPAASAMSNASRESRGSHGVSDTRDVAPVPTFRPGIASSPVRPVRRVSDPINPRPPPRGDSERKDLAPHRPARPQSGRGIRPGSGGGTGGAGSAGGRRFTGRRFRQAGSGGAVASSAPPSRTPTRPPSRDPIRQVTPIKNHRGEVAGSMSRGDSDSAGDGEASENPFGRKSRSAKTPQSLLERQRRRYSEHVASSQRKLEHDGRGGGTPRGSAGSGGTPHAAEGGQSPTISPRRRSRRRPSGLRVSEEGKWDDEGKAGYPDDDNDDNDDGFDPILLSSKGRVLLRASMTRDKFMWKKGKALGRGTFATVYKALNERTGGFMAVKLLPLKNSAGVTLDKSLAVVAKEVSLMRRLHHAHIVQYLGCERVDDGLAVFMELVPGGGTLRNLIKEFGALQEGIIRNYTRQMLSGLAYLHSQGVVHRDIKGANTLITTEGIAKLSDFGCSSQLDGDQTRSMNASLRKVRGTIPFMAPEVVREGAAGRKSDIWSLGCTVIEMASGKPPWQEFSNPISAMITISRGNPPEIPDTLSPEGQDFVRQCLQVDPQARPSAVDLLQHAWLMQDEADLADTGASLLADGLAAAQEMVATMELHGTMGGSPQRRQSSPRAPAAADRDAPSPRVANARSRRIPRQTARATTALESSSGSSEDEFDEYGWFDAKGGSGTADHPQAVQPKRRAPAGD